jgi:acyl-CoA reductase-like NAD-dependent aldehyde dehydrogenase
MTKNRLAAVVVHEAIKPMKTVGIVAEDRERGILEIATPVGVVAAIIPSTNPTSTAIYKTLISLKARNAVVLSPHPSAVRCIRATAEAMIRAAQQAGAPDGLIACMEHSTMQGTQELWKQREVGIILATGGSGLVRAAYASGKPAFGVGPGNVPAFIERTADIPKAVADVFAGKTFDYGTICSSEQAIVCEETIREKVLEECVRQGAHLLTPEEIQKVGALVFKSGSHTPNPQVVGKAATVIAEMAGVRVAPETRVLIARLEGVGREVPLSAEKLSPILAFYSVANAAAGFELCQKLLRFGGAGHTAAVHTQDRQVAAAYGLAVPAFRICVNTASVHGSIGYSTNLFPAMTLGCGAVGGNITSDNIGPQHLMNIKRVAWEARGVEHRTIPAARRLLAETPTEMARGNAPAPSGGAALVALPAAASEKPVAGVGGKAGLPDRAAVAQAVASVMQQLGIPRGAPRPAGPPSAPPVVAAPAAATSAAEEIVGRIFAQRGHAHGAAQPPAAAPASSAGLPPLANQAPAKAPPAAQVAPAEGPAPDVAAFVSEADVRQAISRGEKIFIGPKTIVTPAARDLGTDHDVLVETTLPPSAPARASGRSSL